MVPRNIHIRTSSLTERNFSSSSAATRMGSALVISSLMPTPMAPKNDSGLPGAPRSPLMLTATLRALAGPDQQPEDDGPQRRDVQAVGPAGGGQVARRGEQGDEDEREQPVR